jgi:hypothetical protein
MKARTQRVLIWLAPIMVLIWLSAFLVAGFLPVPSPADSAEQVAAMYDANRTAIRFGVMLTIAAAAMLAPFVGIVTAQLQRVEGRSTPLAYAQLAMGALLILEFVYPMMIVQVAAYRGERPASTIQALHDLAWMLFVGVVSTVFIQFLVIGLAILQDRRADPVFPRWAAYFNIWAALMMVPGSVLPFFKTGPLAWNGIVTFYLVASAFTTWLLVMSYLLLKAVDHEEREGAALEAALPDGDPDGMRRELAALRAEVARLSGLVEPSPGASTRLGGSPIT